MQILINRLNLPLSYGICPCPSIGQLEKHIASLVTLKAKIVIFIFKRICFVNKKTDPKFLSCSLP